MLFLLSRVPLHGALMYYKVLACLIKKINNISIKLLRHQPLKGYLVSNVSCAHMYTCAVGTHAQVFSPTLVHGNKKRMKN